MAAINTILKAIKRFAHAEYFDKLKRKEIYGSMY